MNKQLNRIYTGVGSRETPFEVLKQIAHIAQSLSVYGFTLRSGGADGADKAFELDSIKKEIYLPWPNFNNNNSKLFVISEKARKIASEHHPVWSKLKPPIQNLHARNAYQVLGYDLNKPSDFTVCWTQDGCETRKQRTFKTGGTGTAIAISDTYGVPVFNLKNSDAYGRLKEFLRDRKISI